MTNADEPINPISHKVNYITEGLTKREYFAAMAMQGILATTKTYTIDKKGGSTSESAANKIKFALIMADELLKQLDK